MTAASTIPLSLLRWRLLAIALGLFGSGLAVGLAFAAERAPAEATVKVALENPRVAVRVIDIAPGGQRSGRSRPTDEVVLFCDEAHYQAVDAQGHKEARDRMPGTAVFHNKGEVAPTLVNTGTRPVHYFGISLK
jgi:hypothetical protein